MTSVRRGRRRAMVTGHLCFIGIGIGGGGKRAKASRATEMARRNFHRPARATPPPPKSLHQHCAKPSSGETNPSRVSQGPGEGVSFSSAWPGSKLGQGRKQGHCAPTSARPS
jgi:hypothetical protein